MQSTPEGAEGNRTEDDVVPSLGAEPAVGIEPTTARLRIGCSTTELRWRSDPTTIADNALARTRTATPCGTTPSRWRVYQFHHQGAHCSLVRCCDCCSYDGTDGARTRDLQCDRASRPEPSRYLRIPNPLDGRSLVVL